MPRGRRGSPRLDVLIDSQCKAADQCSAVGLSVKEGSAQLGTRSRVILTPLPSLELHH